MVHLTHSSLHWRLRCIDDSSDEENTPPNTQRVGQLGKQPGTKDSSTEDDSASCGTATPPWLSPGHSKRYTKSGKLRVAPDPARSMRSTPSVEPPATPPATARRPPSPTTSSPVLLETPPRAPLRPIAPQTKPAASARHVGRQARRHAAEPYARAHPVMRQARTPVVNTTSEIPQRVRSTATHPGDVFVPASWPYGVAHLQEQFNPLATVFPAVPHFGWCDCSWPCRVGSYRNSLMNLYCNINSCPFDGKCGNGLEESAKVFLGRNTRTSVLGVVAAEDIGAGEVLGQYLDEMEHVRVSRADRPRNYGYRLMMKQRLEKPNRPVRVAINAERMGSLMRFVNHSCKPVAKFIEVANGRRTTVVVATTEGIHRGQEVTVDYGDDLWFVCRCQLPGCVHRDIQGDQDP